jgi:tetratricopeptide (TPR) repeat protein
LATLAILAGFGLGAAAAWMTRPRSLLEVDPDELPKVERMASARSQYYHANLVNSEAAWNAIAEYFPPEDDSQGLYYSRLAKKGLAELYLRDENFNQALRLFDELANLEPTEDQFRTYGLAGQALVYRRLGEHDKVKAILPHILDKIRYLDRDTRATIEHMAEEYREQADASPSPTN